MTNEDLLREAMTLHQAGHLMDAEQRYREIPLCSPRHAETLRLLGWLHLQRGQPAEATHAIRESLALKPDSPAAHANLALALQALGQHGNAIPHFDHALT